MSFFYAFPYITYRAPHRAKKRQGTAIFSVLQNLIYMNEVGFKDTVWFLPWRESRLLRMSERKSCTVETNSNVHVLEGRLLQGRDTVTQHQYIFVFFICGGIFSTVTDPIHKGDLCLQFWTILTIFDNFDFFCQIWQFVTIFENVWNLWQLLPFLIFFLNVFSSHNCYTFFLQFLQMVTMTNLHFFWQCLNILKWVYNFYNVDNFL